MREILFRGKHGGNWFEGNLVMYNGKPVISRQAQDAPGTVGYEVNPETVCQFTGKHDGSGVKIFEHDIVQLDDGCYAEILWDEDEALFNIYGGDASDIYEDFRTIESEDVEVIGNIFDNPELMKGGAV